MYKEVPLTKIEKIRAKTMMRNNRIFQSLGISAIVSMIRKSNDGPEGSAVTSNDASSAITQGSSSDYCPNEDEVIAEDEIHDTIVEKEVKVQFSLVWRGWVTMFAVCFFFVNFVRTIFLLVI